MPDNGCAENEAAVPRRFRDFPKSIGCGGGGVGQEQRGGGSSVFEPLVRGEPFNFQLTVVIYFNRATKAEDRRVAMKLCLHAICPQG